jgi:hypothetical protein
MFALIPKILPILHGILISFGLDTVLDFIKPKPTVQDNSKFYFIIVVTALVIIVKTGGLNGANKRQNKYNYRISR